MLTFLSFLVLELRLTVLLHLTAVASIRHLKTDSKYFKILEMLNIKLFLRYRNIF